MSTISRFQLQKIRAGLQVNHYGPGPHKDGSSQDVHGKKGAGGGKARSAETKTFKGTKNGNRVFHRDTEFAWKDDRKNLSPKDLKIGDEVIGTYNDGRVSAVGMLRGHNKGNFYIQFDQDLVEFPDSKVEIGYR